MKTIIVAGLGRCGTSLVMSMLDCAGVPTIGQAPDFEDPDHAGMLEHDPDGWLLQGRGKAFKLLDPHRFPLPDLRGVDALFLIRDPKEQAKSQVKLLGSIFAMVAGQNNRETVRALAASNRRDTPVALDHLRRAGANVRMVVSFAGLVGQPKNMALQICAELGLDPLCASAMAALVDRRTPRCLPYLREAFA